MKLVELNQKSQKGLTLNMSRNELDSLLGKDTQEGILAFDIPKYVDPKAYHDGVIKGFAQRGLIVEASEIEENKFYFRVRRKNE